MFLRLFQHTEVKEDGTRGDGVKVPTRASVDVRKPDKKNKDMPYTIIINEALNNGMVNGVFIVFDNEKEYSKFLTDLDKKA